MPLETVPFDTAHYLTEPDDQADLISAAVATGDAAAIKHALNTVVRARNLAQVARDAGVSRSAIYKALGPDGDPRLSTVLGVLASLGIQLSAKAISDGGIVSD